MTRNVMKDGELRSATSLVARLGPHPATAEGLDLDADSADRDLWRWLVLAILLGGRTSESAARDAYVALEKKEMLDAAPLESAGAGVVHACLEDAGLAKSEGTAAVLVRVASNLGKRHDGSIERLAEQADGLEELAHHLSRLGAGFGRSAIFRFLLPLRGRWSAAGDLPATEATRAAGVHVGIVSEMQDAEGTPAALAHWLAGNESHVDAVPLRDLEAALDRLGRRSCLRERSDRCPLEAACPLRERSP